MMSRKNRLARKLILVVFVISFLLIIGSFIYFYFSAKSFVFDETAEDLNIHYTHFVNASKNKIEEYNNEIDGHFFELRNSQFIQLELSVFIEEYLKNNQGKVDEIYVFDRKNKKAIFAVSSLVFGGKQVIQFETISDVIFETKENSLTKISEFSRISYFAKVNKSGENEYFIKKEINNHSMIIKLNKVELFNGVINTIYHPENLNFSIINEEDVIDFSTNILWINQSLNNCLNYEIFEDNFLEDYSKSIIGGRWNEPIFTNTLLVTIDISSVYKDFNNIILRIFIYSILVLLAIMVFTLIYANRISKSLSEISNVTQSVSSGNFGNKINVNRNDELGELINSFNKMIDNLQDSYAKLDFTNKELENKIEELIKTKSELTKKQKLALIGETISKISHEIQNKISGVSVWVQNLEMQSDLNNATKIYVTEIKNSLNSFIEMLLNFKKFYRKPFLEKSKFSLKTLIDNVIDQFQPELEAKNINVRKIFLGDKENMVADRTLIEELLLNIIVNAIYFSPIDSQITIEVHFESPTVKIIISDEGPGISEKNIENIFHPFFTTKPSGSGLGLAICKNIVEAHNGEIKVTSGKEGGTKFTVIFSIISNGE